MALRGRFYWREHMPRGIPNNLGSVSPGKTFEPMEQQIGQDAPRVMKSTGPAKEALEPAYIQAVDRPVDGEKMAMLAFMELPVTIHVHTSSDPAAEEVFVVINGGQREMFKRGETKTVKRKFVDILATRKLTSYTQRRVRGDDGVMQDVQVPHSSLKYPFSVIEDKHPRGADWLKAMLASA